jgi:DNA-binding transcriptional MerR regulator
MGERSYLAIGDVLALLREEFPDVTISKIRFLESRGLVDPERTPSGYRKFYEPDVERLRWILRQQREHFLPLKVIKGRLEHGMDDPEVPAQHLFEVGEPPPSVTNRPKLVGVNGTGEAKKKRDDVALSAFASLAVAASGGGGVLERSVSSVPAKDVEHSSGVESRRRDPMGPNEQGAITQPNDTSQSQQLSADHTTSEEKPASRRRRKPRRVVESTDKLPAASSDAHDPSAEDLRPGGEAKASRAHIATRPTSGLPGAGVSGVSFTIAELASASGLDMAGVEELESFGLIAGRTVAGVHCYDEEAVVVAKLAAGFAAYGIGARHLRLFKHAADRQTGLFAQVVTPLLRQRNPEARARAIEDLSELAGLGESLMRCFSQATLRELTGG